MTVAIRGVLAIQFGIVSIIVPGAILISLELSFAAYFIADGIFGIVAAVRAANTKERWGWLIAEGLLNVLVGVVVLVFPLNAVLAFLFVTAAWAIITGVMMLVSALKVNPAFGRLWLGLGGAVSMIFGALLVVAPVVGAVVLTQWLGGYAIAFGSILLIFAFHLRRRRSAAEPLRSF